MMLYKFPESLQINISPYIDRAVNWLIVNLEVFFRGLKTGVLAFLYQVDRLLAFIPWWLAILIVAATGYYITRRVRKAAIYGLMLFFICAIGYWQLMLQTLSVVLTSVLLSVVAGLPLGILCAKSKRLDRVSRPVLDAMQTMPSFVYLIPAVMFFGLGKVSAVFATIIYALPPITRMTNHAVIKVNHEMVEAAKAFGATNWQLLLKVELPQALSTILTGVNQTTMMAVAMVVTCSMIGAKGLGNEVLISIQRLEIGRGAEAGLAIVFVAIILDRISLGLAAKLQKNPEKGEV